MIINDNYITMLNISAIPKFNKNKVELNNETKWEEFKGLLLYIFSDLQHTDIKGKTNFLKSHIY